MQKDKPDPTSIQAPVIAGLYCVVSFQRSSSVASGAVIALDSERDDANA